MSNLEGRVMRVFEKVFSLKLWRELRDERAYYEFCMQKLGKALSSKCGSRNSGHSKPKPRHAPRKMPGRTCMKLYRLEPDFRCEVLYFEAAKVCEANPNGRWVPKKRRCDTPSTRNSERQAEQLAFRVYKLP